VSCGRVRDWRHRDALALDETQRLILDDHLAACERCRGDRHRMLVVRRVGAALPVPPAGSREYSRAIARALLEDSTTARVASLPPPPLRSRRSAAASPARPRSPAAKPRPQRRCPRRSRLR
jgi:hypothetical protein